MKHCKPQILKQNNYAFFIAYMFVIIFISLIPFDVSAQLTTITNAECAERCNTEIAKFDQYKDKFQNYNHVTLSCLKYTSASNPQASVEMGSCINDIAHMAREAAIQLEEVGIDISEQVQETIDEGTADVRGANNITDVSCGYPDDPATFISDLSKKCWYCGIFNSVIKTIQDLANTVYENVKDGLSKLLTACFLVWLVVKILSYISAMHTKSPGEFYNEIGIGILTFLVAFLVLAMGKDLWEYVVTPIVDIAYGYAKASLDAVAVTNSSDVGPMIAVGENISMNTSSDVGSNPIQTVGQRIIGSGETAGGIVVLINEHLMKLIGTGWVIMTAAMKASDLLCFPATEFLLFLSGLVLIVMGVIFLFFIPLMVLDLCFRFGIFFILMPTFVFAWTFKYTRNYTRRGVNLLVQPMFMMLLIAITLAICTQMITAELKLDEIKINNSLAGNLASFKEYYGGGLANLIKAVFLLVFAYEVMKKVPNIADGLMPDSGNESEFGRSGGRRALRKLAMAGVSTGVAAAKVGGKLAQAGARGATRGTRFDTQVRDAKRDGEAASLVDEYKQQMQSSSSNVKNSPFNLTESNVIANAASKNAFENNVVDKQTPSQALDEVSNEGSQVANKKNLRDVKMPNDIAKAIKANPNYQLTPDDVKRVLAENRYRRNGIKGLLSDIGENTSKRAKEKLYSTVTGEKSKNFY